MPSENIIEKKTSQIDFAEEASLLEDAEQPKVAMLLEMITRRLKDGPRS